MDTEMDCSTQNYPIRHVCDYANRSRRFLHISKNFAKQYARIYAARLGVMRLKLIERVKSKWGDKYLVKQLYELKEGKEDTCVVIGTLFKHQELKPSILKELSEELQMMPEPQRKNFVDDGDTLILEDELQRIKLIGDVIDVHQVVTGVVCAILGYEDGDGLFKMIDYCWADCAPQKEMSPFEDDRFLVLVSGLNLSSGKDNCLAIQLFVDWILGLVGGCEQREQASKVVRLIIAGNSVNGLPSDSASSGAIVNTMSSTFSGPEFGSLEALRRLDSVLAELCNSIDVDLMPGEFDPTNIMLPQDPMHCCRSVCGTSGQPIADILRYSKLSSPMEALKSTLKWGHIAPTAPDTLPCTPSDDGDPFIIGDCPRVYFTGNTDKLEVDLFEGSEGQQVCLVCVPSFATTQSCVVVNLRNLECQPISFKIKT